MQLNKLTQLVVLSAILLSSAGHAASNDALLDLLVKKGVLTESEATAVAAELKEENKGVTFSAKGKETVKLQFNGRMQFQYDALGMDRASGDRPHPDDSNHFYFRRLFFGVKANLANGMYAETVLDFAGDENPEVAFEKVYFGYEFDQKLDLQLGFDKVPFGFEETYSSASLPTIERSVANRFFADDIDFSARHAGIHAQGDLGAGFSYALAFVNSAQGEGSRLLGDAESSNDMAAFGRLQWKSNGLIVGLDGGHTPNNAVVMDDVTAFTGYVNYKLDGLDLLGEYFTADMGDAEDAEGFALRASYRMNKFEPVLRYSRLKTDSFTIDVDELIRRAPEGDNPAPVANSSSVDGTDSDIESFYLGLNYYHSPAVTFMTGYEYAEAENDAKTEKVEVEGFRARVQVLW